MASLKSIVALQWLCLILAVTELGAVPMLTATDNSVQLFDSEHPDEVTDVITEREEIADLDFHVIKGELYFSERVSEKTGISKLSLFKDAPKTPIRILDDTYSGSITVDWVHDKLYWTNAGENVIETSNLDGSDRKVIFSRSKGVKFASSLVVDPYERLIFWRNGLEKQVTSGRPDGSSKKVLHPHHLGCYGLTLDISNKVLYFRTDSGLFSSSYDGSNLKTLIPLTDDSVMRYSGLAHYSNKLYYPDNSKKAVIAYNIETNHTDSAFEVKKVTDGQWLESIKVLHASVQPQLHGATQCSKKCSHFCDNSGAGSCKCPHGFTLDQDGITCKKEGVGA